MKREQIFDLLLDITDGVIYDLGAISHEKSGSDESKLLFSNSRSPQIARKQSDTRYRRGIGLLMPIQIIVAPSHPTILAKTANLGLSKYAPRPPRGGGPD